jgi:hypothetical protein
MVRRLGLGNRAVRVRSPELSTTIVKQGGHHAAIEMTTQHPGTREVERDNAPSRNTPPTIVVGSN